MSIATALNTLESRRSDIVASINSKGGTLEDNATLAECKTAIDNLDTGGGGGETVWTGHVDEVGLRAIGWTEDDIEFFKGDICWNEEDDDYYKVSPYNISLYTNADKVVVDGVEMADSSYLDIYRYDRRCRYLPKTDFSALTTISEIVLSGATQIEAVPSFKINSNIEILNTFFYDCSSLISANLSRLDTSNITSMAAMFRNCYSLRSIRLNDLNTSKVTSIFSFLNSCHSLTEIDLTGLDFSNLQNAQDFCNGCNSLTKVKGVINCPLVQTFSGMFENCNSLTDFQVTFQNTVSLINCSEMFLKCYSLKNIDLSSLNTSKVSTFYYMFSECRSLERVDLSVIDLTQSTNFQSMFNLCSSIKEINFGDRKNIKGVNLSSMFYGCMSLKKLDLSVFTKFSNINIMFSNLNSLGSLTLGDDFVFSSGSPASNASNGFRRKLAADFDSVKNIFTAANNSTQQTTAVSIYFESSSVAYDDEEGTLDDLMAGAIANGYTFYNLTIR